jgi:hypothetical protein
MDNYYAHLPKGPAADAIRAACGAYIGKAEEMHAAIAALQIAGVAGDLVAIAAAAVLPGTIRRHHVMCDAARYADRYSSSEARDIIEYGQLIARLQAIAEARSEVAA